MSSVPRKLRMCSVTGKFLLQPRRNGWGPCKPLAKFSAGFYVGRYKNDDDVFYLTIEKADYSKVSHGPHWFHLFDFPENLEPGFAQLVEDKYFQLGVFHD